MLTKWLKEVGRGKRGARDLNYEEAKDAAELILGGKATQAQIGAFFIAERIKMETVEELEAFVHVCRAHAYRTNVHSGMDCAGPYDGRKKSFFATFATAFVLGAAGLPVTLHGTGSLPPKWGITLQDILMEMDIDADSVSRERFIETARETGVLYVSAESWCPPLRELRSIRVELGMRTVLNTAEKLIDYAHSKYLLFGVFHNTVFERMAKLSEKLGYERSLIVQGVEGSEDLFIERPTRTYFVQNGIAIQQIVDPDAYGLETQVPEVEWTAALQKDTVEEVLQGGGHLAFANQVLLNAAVRLHLAGKADSVEQGIYMSKALIDDGEPWKLYSQWKHALQKISTI
ncbi:anthranilate phosphoribosyltransferase [Paenibacillus sp. PL2-23]|uniref:anthranilate phosphoribosyltransferase n=1 Tax=Paenibacillus sp. PL2-23 TaxID=2100729 RepID=UPI0030F5F07D